MFSRHAKPILIAAALALIFAAQPAAAAPVPAGNTGWVWANPLPQGNSLDRIAESGGRVWAGGATGTLMRSDDGGNSWTAIRTGLLDDIRTIEAVSPNSVVFGSGCALRRTDDGGITVRRLAWSASDDSCASKIQTVSFPSALTGYLLLANGDIYITSDSGESWKKQGVAPYSVSAGGTDAVRDMRFDSLGRGVLSVGTRLLHSVDAGANWTPVLTASAGAGLYSFSFVSETVGFAAGDHGHFLSTVDGGATWENVDSDGSTLSESLASLSCVDEEFCVAANTAGTAMLRTADGGAHWSGVSTGADSAAVLLAGGKGVSVGKRGAIATTTNSGATWSLLNARAAGQYNAVRVQTRRIATAVGENGAIARSDDAGASWRATPTPDTNSMLDAVAVGQGMLAVGAGGDVWYTGNSGGQWTKVRTGSSVKTRALLVWKGGRTVLVGPRGVRLSQRWGAKSKAAKGPISRLTLSDADIAGSAAFVHGGRYLAMTPDKGKTWRRLRMPRGATAIAQLDMLNARNGYLLDSTAELYATTDGAKSWRRIETTGANSAVSVAFGDRKRGYIGDATGRILATSDAGATWSRQYPFFDATASSPVLIAASSRLGALALVRGSETIFSTTRGGRIGRASVLRITPSAKRVRRGTVVPVTGRLTPATGVERVAVLARVAGARGGTQWATQNVTVSASGTFTTKWKITASTVFIARWSGDAGRDGDAAPMKMVRLRR